MPTYNQNIPQPTDQISQSQDQILQNFQSIQALVDVNHVDFASGDQGKHKWVTMPTQGAIPPAGSGFTAGEIGEYNAVYATTAKNELFINKTNQATVVQIPSTASILSINSAPTFNGVSAWTYFPSGILIRAGFSSGVTGLTTVTMSTGVGVAPAFNAILNVIVCPYSTATGDDNFAVRFVDVLSVSQFRVYVSSRTAAGAATGGFRWLVIGY